MNSWHTFSPNGRWLAFSSKAIALHPPHMTHIDADGNDSPAIIVDNTTAANRAVNIPEFVTFRPTAWKTSIPRPPSFIALPTPPTDRYTKLNQVRNINPPRIATQPSLPHHGVPDHQPAAGAARARAAATPQYLAGSQCRTARGGGNAGRTGAGAGRRRHRQNPGADPRASPTSSSMGRARPGEILSVTFTNKAAREMKDAPRPHAAARPSKACRGSAPFIRSAVRILRTHAELVAA